MADGQDDFLIGANDHDEFYDQDGAAYLLYGNRMMSLMS